jgi:DNA-binding NarL/FixJ family response regulator
MNKKILLATPKHMISEGLSMRLLQEPDLTIVGWAQSVAEFEALYASCLPDVVLICIHFKAEQTARYLRAFVSHDDRANFLVFSNSIQRHLIIEVMESGAKGFVSPIHTGLDEMVAAARSVANGNTYVCQKAAECLLGGLFNRNQPVHNESLSDREKQVIRLVSDGLTSKEIARILFISPSTVEVHRRNIMRKIGAHKTADLTRYAIRSQLVSL